MYSCHATAAEKPTTATAPATNHHRGSRLFQATRNIAAATRKAATRRCITMRSWKAYRRSAARNRSARRRYFVSIAMLFASIEGRRSWSEILRRVQDDGRGPLSVLNSHHRSFRFFADRGWRSK